MEVNNGWLTYDELPESCRYALQAYWYMDDLSMLQVEERSQNFIFRFDPVPIEVAKELCMKHSSDLSEAYDSFEDYHRDYANGGDIPNHGASK